MTKDQRAFYTSSGQPHRLTQAEVDQIIQAFDSKASPVRRIAVENFLMSAPLDLKLSLQLMNLRMDAQSYGWSQATVDCIAEGLRRMNA